MSGGGGAWMTGLNDRMTNSTNSSSGWCMSVIGGGGGGRGRAYLVWSVWFGMFS